MGAVLQEHEAIPGDIQVRQGQHPGGGARQRRRGLLHRSVPAAPAGALPSAVCALPAELLPCPGCFPPLGAAVRIFGSKTGGETNLPRRERGRAAGFTAGRSRLPGSRRGNRVRGTEGQPGPRNGGGSSALPPAGPGKLREEKGELPGQALQCQSRCSDTAFSRDSWKYKKQESQNH